LNSIERKFRLLKSLGVRKSIYVWLFRLFDLFSGFYTTVKYAYEEKRWYTNIILRKEYHNQIFEKNLSSIEKNEIKEYFARYGLQTSYDWHQMYYSVSGIYSKEYIPENLFNLEIEPVLNNFDSLKTFSDKNLYQKLIPDDFQPKTLLRCINGKLYSEKYEIVARDLLNAFLADKDGLYIVKQARNSFGGRNIYVIEVKDSTLYINNQETDIPEIINKCSSNFIIQYYVTQNRLFHALNPSSLNTTRVITLRMNNNIRILSAYLKVGSKGSHVDNITSGGFGLGINKNGKLSDYCIDSYSRRADNLPGIVKNGELAYYPCYNKIKTAVKSLHQQIPDFDIISWDMVIDIQNKPVMIEYNLKMQDSETHQLFNGPLFGDFTNNVLAEVVRRKNLNVE